MSAPPRNVSTGSPTALRFAVDRLKTVLEPSGATGLAALLTGKVSAARVGVILSGGNVGAARLAELLG